MVLYILNSRAKERLTDKPHDVFIIVKFFHQKEKFDVLVWPTHNQFESDAILTKYETLLSIPRHRKAMPYLHKLAYAERFMQHGYVEDIRFRDDVTNRDEYIDIIDSTLIIPHKLKEIKIGTLLVNKLQPEKEVSFIRNEMEGWKRKSEDLKESIESPI